MEYLQSTYFDSHELAEIRAAAMKPSLEALGRFDENRVRSRFLDSFVPNDTFKIVSNSQVLGFFVVREKEDHIYLDHLYVEPGHQNKNIGKMVIDMIKVDALGKKLPVRLGALRGSKSNAFYVKNGFQKTHEDEFDVYYEYQSN